MNISISSIKQNLTYILLSALTGAVLATGMVVILVSEKIGALQLAQWQIAAIYVAVIAASILLGVKGSTKKCATDQTVSKTDSDKIESKPA